MIILMKSIAGSHLFGTNTETSDMDYKGIYFPELNDLLLSKAQGTINIKRDKAHGERNTKDDVDVELFSFHKFMYMLYEGQTVALELVWTPDHLIVEQHPMWKDIRDTIREELMHKKVTSFVGYCKTQADKYGVKGSRMAAVKEAINTLELLRREYGADVKLGMGKIWDELRGSLRGLEHIVFDEQETHHGTISYMQICERKYQYNQSLGYTINALQKVYDSYGARAKQAETNEGVDFKALSHAYRVCVQAIELLRDHKITLPLEKKDLDIVRDIKLGLISFKEYQPMLENKLAEVLYWEKNTTLPENFDYIQWCEEGVISLYVQELIYNQSIGRPRGE